MSEDNIIKTVTNKPKLEDFGAVKTEASVKDNHIKYTQSCPECGTVFMKWVEIPGITGHVHMQSVHVFCCKKIRIIGHMDINEFLGMFG